MVKFETGDIVENFYTAQRAGVVSFIAYPPELELIIESGNVFTAHADDWYVIQSVREVMENVRICV
jgi:hypothetical protein